MLVIISMRKLAKAPNNPLFDFSKKRWPMFVKSSPSSEGQSTPLETALLWDRNYLIYAPQPQSCSPCLKFTRKPSAENKKNSH